MRPSLRSSAVVALALAVVALGAGCGSDSSDTVGGCEISPGTSCPGADLSGADLEDADLSQADLSDATLHETNLSGANLSEANLGGAQITDADLSDADLTGAAGQWQLEYVLPAGAEVGRVRIDDLDLVRRLADAGLLDKDAPCRVILGARLAGVSRERKAWWVRLEPDSGVLLTDAPALEAACDAYHRDREVAAVLKRQAGWLAELP